jgi:hypothetical protein
VDIGEPDRDPLLIGNIDASDPRHLRFSSKEQKWVWFALSQGRVL